MYISFVSNKNKAMMSKSILFQPPVLFSHAKLISCTVGIKYVN